MEKTAADFTNTFRGLSELLLPGSSGYEQSKEDTLQYILSQCATVEELKKIHKPKMDPRFSIHS